MAGILVGVLVLSGCTHYGSVRFHHHTQGGGAGGYGSTDEVTTYTVEPRESLATVKSSFDSWEYDPEGRTDANGCTYHHIHRHAEATRTGWFTFTKEGPFFTASLRAGTIPAAPLTYPVMTTEHVGCGFAPNDPVFLGTFATRTASDPDLDVLNRKPDGSWVGVQDDCPRVEVNDVEHCWVVYDVHPQPAPVTTAR
jgi:hypothetical protein